MYVTGKLSEAENIFLKGLHDAWSLDSDELAADSDLYLEKFQLHQSEGGTKSNKSILKKENKFYKRIRILRKWKTKYLVENDKFQM